MLLSHVDAFAYDDYLLMPDFVTATFAAVISLLSPMIADFRCLFSSPFSSRLRRAAYATPLLMIILRFSSFRRFDFRHFFSR